MKDRRAFKVKAAYKIYKGQQELGTVVGGTVPREGTAQPDPLGWSTHRMGIIQHWGGSQACWEECWSLQTPTALLLSATFSCPDLPTALLVYKEKCTQRLRPQLGGEG